MTHAGQPCIYCSTPSFLTPPATSTNVERLFSYAGLIARPKRSIKPMRVQQILFLRENLAMMNFRLEF